MPTSWVFFNSCSCNSFRNWIFSWYVMFSMVTLGGAAANRFIFFCCCFSAVTGLLLFSICRYAWAVEVPEKKLYSRSWGATTRLSAVLKLIIKTGITTPPPQLPLWCSFLSKYRSIIQVKKCKYRQGPVIIGISNYKHQHRGETPKRTLRHHGVHPLHEGARIAGGLPSFLWNTSVGFMGIPQMLWCVLHARLPHGILA